MKHLLLVSHFFPPMGGGGVQRVTKFVKYLRLHGWRTTVLCGRAEDYWMRDESLLADVPPETRVLRTAAASGLGVLRRLRGDDAAGRRSSQLFALLRRGSAWFLVPDSYVGWLPFALRAAEAVLRDDPPDALLSSGPPDTNHLVALRLRQDSAKPWVADFRDPWVGLHLLEPPTPWHRRRHASLEREVLAAADAVVATTTWLRDLLRERSPHNVRLQVIRNGYDPDDFAGSPAYTPAKEGPLRLAHTGMLTLTRSVRGLLQALAQVHQRHPELRGQIHLELIGARESDNDAEVARLGLQDSVVLRGPVPHAEAIAATLRADVLVLLKHTSERYVGLVPGKFYEYLGSGRPLLALVPESEAAHLVRDLGCGAIAPPDDPEAIASVLLQLLAAKRDGSLAGLYRRAALPVFQRPEQASNLAALLDQVVAAAPTKDGSARTEGPPSAPRPSKKSWSEGSR